MISNNSETNLMIQKNKEVIERTNINNNSKNIKHIKQENMIQKLIR